MYEASPRAQDGAIVLARLVCRHNTEAFFNEGQKPIAKLLDLCCNHLATQRRHSNAWAVLAQTHSSPAWAVAPAFLAMSGMVLA